MAVQKSAILRIGLLLVGVPILFQLIALALLLKAQTDTSDAEQWELHSKEVISRAADLELTLNHAHGALRGEAVYRTLEFERDRREALGRWPALLGDLRRLVSDNPRQQDHVDRIRQAAGPYFAWFTAMERLGASSRWDAFNAELRTARGKTLIDAVEAALGDFSREETRLDRARLAAVAATRTRERQMLFIIAVLAVALAVGLLVAFVRGFSQRLARITINSQRLATGEALIDPLPGDDELASLDAVLHESSRRLAEASAAEKRYATQLEERGRALEQANKDLLFRRQENEMFVYSVSHDLRSPLVNVQGFTKELTQACQDLRGEIARASIPGADRDRLERILDTDIAEAISFIQSAVTRLSAIVDALLRLSRAGRVEFTAQRVDLGPIVERIARAMRVSIEQRRADVSWDRLPAVLGDPVAIEQVLANLIGNALNYLDPGRPGRVEIGIADDTGQPPSEVTVYVRDNGLGIPDRYLSKLFMPFERLHGNVAKGEGIGLALAKRIVDRHGGRIWAESVEHAGTTFFVALPRADVTEAPAVATAAAK